MEQLIDALRQALAADGIVAVAAMPATPSPRLRGAACAVSMKSATGERCQYLGTVTDAQDGEREIYGRRLTAELLIEVFSPAALGGSACAAAAERVAGVLSAGIAGISVSGFCVGTCSYHAVNDCFSCQITVQCSAYLYAVPEQDGSRFTDFSLRGDLS